MRYSMLETIRQYAREKLFEAGEAARARDRHFAFYEDFSKTAWDGMRNFGNASPAGQDRR